jgi:hypothetical protein
LLALAWLVVVVVMAAAGAGVVAQWSHLPGTSARAELTWHGDQELGRQLDAAQADLEAIGEDVDRPSVLAHGGARRADRRRPGTVQRPDPGR